MIRVPESLAHPEKSVIRNEHLHPHHPSGRTENHGLGKRRKGTENRQARTVKIERCISLFGGTLTNHQIVHKRAAISQFPAALGNMIEFSLGDMCIDGNS